MEIFKFKMADNDDASSCSSHSEDLNPLKKAAIRLIM